MGRRFSLVVIGLAVAGLLALVAAPALAQDANQTARAGMKAFRARNYAQAEQLFTQALNQGLTGQRRATIHWMRGSARFRLNNYPAAIQDFNSAIALDPNKALYFRSRGSARAKLKKYTQALADFNQAVRLDPKSVKGYLYRGLTQAILGKYNLGITDFTTAIRLDPKSILAFRMRAMTYTRMGRKDLAKADQARANQLAAQKARTEQQPRPKPDTGGLVTTKKPDTRTATVAPLDPTGLWFRRLYTRHAMYFRIVRQPGTWPMPHTFKMIFSRASLPMPILKPGSLAMVFTITGPTTAKGMVLYAEMSGVQWVKCDLTFADPKTIVVKITDPNYVHAPPTTFHRAK
ncbi:MAG: tetratricopeptide repeat protein [Proteobacteria bacterium]|nr:tetratricopeptide repeat protein [Pseudomonadota bacterium]MBU1742591.1 tetratricopeptide repeat protein [Pseudomonadota bacterium]